VKHRPRHGLPRFFEENSQNIMDFILPPGVSMPKPIQPVDSPDLEAPDSRRAAQLPDPTGWKILCIVPDVTETFDGSSIVKADSFMKQEEHATTVLFVLKVGPDAYKDTEKFPSGPWCKPGDFVLVRTYSGTRFKIHGKEFRLLNDDQIDAVVEDPRGVTRVAV
jgi:co-chaperonin GroES (HSP10)